MTTRRAQALLLASWALGGCNVLVGLDDVNILQPGDGGSGGATSGAGATTAGSGTAPGATGPEGNGAAEPTGGGAGGSTPGGAGGTGETSSSTGTGGEASTSSSTGAGGEASTSSSTGSGGSTSSSGGSGGSTSSSGGSGGSTPCGDGYLAGGEQCDDGNPTGGDGCSADCAVEPFHQCTVPGPSLCVPQETLCGDGTDNDGDSLIDAGDPDCALPAYMPAVPCQSIRIYRSINVPLAIPDSGAGSAYSPIFVPDSFAVARTTVILDVSHPRIADIGAVLLPPFGPPRILTSDNGGNGSDYAATLFDQACPVSVTAGLAPFDGCYKPEAFLPANGQSASGEWALDVADFSSGKTGTLTGWTLILCAQ